MNSMNGKSFDSDVFNSLEEELWRIFTYYSLFYNPSEPEMWSKATFVKFAKDCQILGKDSHINSVGLTVPLLELEIAKLSNQKDRLEREKSDYSPSSVTIQFKEFLSILYNISIKVYRGQSNDIATRRLLLENVLLLANRRISLKEHFDPRNKSAWSVMNLYRKALRNVFKYYLAKAEMRQNVQLANQATYVSKLQLLGASISTEHLDSEVARLNSLKVLVQSQRELIGFIEFHQFSHDYGLKTLSLTSVKVAQIFLQVVPLDTQLKASRGMNFDCFCEALVYMALLAFKVEGNRYDPNDEDGLIVLGDDKKVQALLLHMWKVVNNDYANRRLLRDRDQRDTPLTITPAGIQDVYGSSLLSEQFLEAWRDDGFCEYFTPHHNTDSTALGTTLLKNLTLDDVRNKSRSLSHRMSIHSALTATTSMSQPHFETEGDSYHNDMDRKGSASLDPILLSSSQLRVLFQLRPELSEFIYLQLQQQN